MKRRDFLRGTACALPTAFVAFASRYAAAEAEQFPAHYMTLVVPFGAGGPPDVIARIVAAKLGDVLGKPVIVDNRPGASSSLAATDVARSPADGYTLLLADMSFVVAPHLFTNMRANPLTDFAPVGLSAKSQFALMVSPNLDTPTVADFIKLAKAKGEGVTIGHSGIGTTPHLAAITFTKAAGINPLLISYRAITQAADDVLAGQISCYFSAAAQGIGLAKSGKVRVLGVTGAARLRELPDVPTFSESGITMKGFRRRILVRNCRAGQDAGGCRHQTQYRVEKLGRREGNQRRARRDRRAAQRRHAGRVRNVHQKPIRLLGRDAPNGRREAAMKLRAAAKRTQRAAFTRAAS